MENSWIEEFYGETDADKRLELLENNSTDMDGDSAGSSTVFRQRLWTARYGKRKPKNDAFVGCLMELKYIWRAVLLTSEVRKRNRLWRS